MCNYGQCICLSGLCGVDQASLWDPLHGPWTTASNPKLLRLADGLAVDPWKWRWRIAAISVLVGIASLGLPAVDFLVISVGWGSDAGKSGTLFTSLMFSGRVEVSVVRFKSTPPSSVYVATSETERRRQTGSHRRRRAGITGVSPQSDHKQKRRCGGRQEALMWIWLKPSWADVLSLWSALFVVFYQS